MKKVFAVVLVLAMCLSLGAWTSQEAYNTYLAMNEAMGEVTSVETNMRGTLTMQMPGMRTDMFIKAVAKEIYNEDGAVEMEMDMTMDALGVSADTKAYYKDGWMYQEVLGEKMRYQLNVEDLASEMAMTSIDFDRSLILSSSVKEVAAGKQLDFTLDASVLNDAMDTFLGILDDMEGLNLTFGNVSYTIIVDDNNIMKSYTMKFDAKTTVAGSIVTVSCDVTADIVSFNTDLAIAYPQDLEEYEDVTELITGAPAAQQPEAEAAEVAAPAVQAETAAEPQVEAEDAEDAAEEAVAEEAIAVEDEIDLSSLPGGIYFSNEGFQEMQPFTFSFAA